MIDSHCHLDHEPLYSDLQNVIKRSKEIGIKKLLTICTTLSSFNKIIDLIKIDEIIYGTFGIHPHESENDIVDINLIKKNIKDNNKIIGIGETGLDFYYNHSNKRSQIQSFEEHIKASIDLKIPLIIHSRNAENETFEILNNYKNYEMKILMHCFTGSKEFSKKLLKLDAYFSASGIITFNNSIELQETFKFLPLEKLLIETDSPYLSPVPNRGKKNEPSFIKHTAEKLATIKKIPTDQLIDETSKNFNQLFQIDK